MRALRRVPCHPPRGQVQVGVGDKPIMPTRAGVCPSAAGEPDEVVPAAGRADRRDQLMSATAAPATAASPATMATTPKITGPCIVATAPTTTSMMPRNQAAPAEKARRRPVAFIVPDDVSRKSAPLSSRSIRSSWCCSSSAQAVPSVSSVLDPRRRGDESELRADHPPRAGPDRPGPRPVPYPVVAQQTTTRTRRDRCQEHRTIVGAQRTRRVPCGRKKNIKIPGLPFTWRTGPAPSRYPGHRAAGHSVSGSQLRRTGMAQGTAK